LIGFLACQPKTQFELKHAAFDKSEIAESLQTELKHWQADDSSNCIDSIYWFYEQKAFEPIWFAAMQNPKFRSTVLAAFDSAVYEGLSKSHYPLDSFNKYQNLIHDTLYNLNYQIWAKADLYTSMVLYMLWHDKVLGHTNPYKVLGQKYTLPYPNHPWYRAFAVLNPSNGISQLQAYNPSDSDYFKLKAMLRKAYKSTQGSETMIDTTGINKIKLGDSSIIIPLLARRLVELGYAPNDFIESFAQTLQYKRHLYYCVKAFQKEANLSDDGVIGSSTLKQLNLSSNDKIETIKANLERIRWQGQMPQKPYIKVNIPEFMLYLYSPDTTWQMRVCVGKGKEKYYDAKLKQYLVSKQYLEKPMNHETPQVYSLARYVVLNPTWTVPSSIVGRELFNLILKDPNYLKKNHFQVLKNGVMIDPNSINWHKYRADNIPFTIRQAAGEDNSLGVIKIDFLNPFDVYMHDTPLKDKFKLNNRAVSHGCVRLESPFILTDFLLSKNLKNNHDDLRIMMGQMPKDTAKARLWMNDTGRLNKVIKTTKYIKVEQAIPIFFDYKTIVFDSLQRPRFLFDVYDKNKLISDQLK